MECQRTTRASDKAYLEVDTKEGKSGEGEVSAPDDTQLKNSHTERKEREGAGQVQRGGEAHAELR